MKKILVTILILIGFMAFNMVRAETILNQPIKTDFMVSELVTDQSVGQTFSTINTNIGDITFHVKCFESGACNGLYAEIYSIPSPVGLTPASISTSTLTLLATSTNQIDVANGSEEDITFWFNNIAIGPIIGNYVVIHQTSGTGGLEFYGSATTDQIAGVAYANGGVRCDIFTSCSPGVFGDMYLIVNSFSPPPSNINIFVTYPATSSTVTTDFNSYELQFYNTATTTNKIKIYLQAGYPTFRSEMFDEYPLGASSTIFSPGWTKIIMQKQIAIGYGLYYIQAVVFNQIGQVVATGTIQTFTYAWPTGLTTSPVEPFQYETCSTSTTFLGMPTADSLRCEAVNGFKKFGNDLYIGIQVSVQTIGNLIKKVFPISIFEHVNNDFAIAMASTTEDLKLSVAFHSDLHDEITLYNSSTITQAGNKIGVDFVDLFKKFMYLLTGAVIIGGSWLAINHLRQHHA